MNELDDEQHGTDYLAPSSVEAALALLAAHGDDAKLVAGGQSLLVFLRQGLLAPRWLIGLKGIPELTVLEPTAVGGLTIGAMVTQHRLETDPLVRDSFPALAEAAAAVASPLVRRQGTLGGNLCHADPTGDPPAALIALGAEIEIAGPRERRLLPVEELFTDYMETTLTPEELLVAVHLPPPGSHAGAAYCKHRIRGVDTALVGAGVGVRLADDGKTCLDARIGLVGAGTIPVRARQAEAALRGRPLSSEAFDAAGQIASEECEPLSDTEGSEWYRHAMIAVFVRRAGETALHRARAGEAQ
jgi:carbon-monoxide dehydrogenase medium subunit